MFPFVFSKTVYAHVMFYSLYFLLQVKLIYSGNFFELYFKHDRLPRLMLLGRFHAVYSMRRKDRVASARLLRIIRTITAHAASSW